jgi:hypothetical protein
MGKRPPGHRTTFGVCLAAYLVYGGQAFIGTAADGSS